MRPSAIISKFRFGGSCPLKTNINHAFCEVVCE
jgi:hypothetical protein